MVDIEAIAAMDFAVCNGVAVSNIRDELDEDDLPLVQCIFKHGGPYQCESTTLHTLALISAKEHAFLEVLAIVCKLKIRDLNL